MYFYTISEGCYSDYSHTTIYHKEEISRKDFIHMYNKAIDFAQGKGKYVYRGHVIEFLCEKYGFIEIKEHLEINKDYGSLEKITDQGEIEGDHTFISIEDDE